MMATFVFVGLSAANLLADLTHIQFLMATVLSVMLATFIAYLEGDFDNL